MSGFFDFLGSDVKGLGGIASAVTPVAQLGLGAWQAYEGIQGSRQASKYYDNMAGTAALQDQIAREQMNRLRPLLDSQTHADLQDAQRYGSPEFNQYRTDLDRSGYLNAMSQSRLQGQSLGYAEQLMPGQFSSAQQDLVSSCKNF